MRKKTYADMAAGMDSCDIAAEEAGSRPSPITGNEMERAREMAIATDPKCHDKSSESGMWQERYLNGLYDNGPRVTAALGGVRARDRAVVEALTKIHSLVLDIQADTAPESRANTDAAIIQVICELALPSLTKQGDVS